jgi:hypothetical protein
MVAHVPQSQLPYIRQMSFQPLCVKSISSWKVVLKFHPSLAHDFSRHIPARG